MTVRRRKDRQLRSVFMHKLADVRGGVSVATSELGGPILLEGAVLSKPVSGITHVCKFAKVVEAVEATAKTVKVAKDHNFKVGQFITAGVGEIAATITAIEEGKESDTLTLDAALGALGADKLLVEAAAKTTAKESALKYEPVALCGTTKAIEPKSNLDTDAILIGVTTGHILPECFKAYLPNIINY